MLFLGDEGRDVLVVKRIIIDHQWTLLGPITSVGAMYLGPIYYYFMIPFLWLWHFNPVGPAIMVALFSLATIVLIWQLGREFLDEKTAVIASFLYAISPLVIIHSHSSWNPNILPFFALLAVYSLLKIVVKQKYLWFWVLGLSLGVVLQLHYLALLLLGVTFFTLALKKFKFKVTAYLSLILGFLLTFWPFLLFELRHRFPNTQTIWRFITAGDFANPSSLHFGYDRFFHTINDVAIRFFWRLIVVFSPEWSKLFLLVVLGTVFFWWLKSRKENSNLFLSLSSLFIWFLVGVFGLGFYRGAIYDYYFVSLFPLPFLLTGFAFGKIADQKIGKWLVLAVLVFLAVINLRNTSIARPPNKLVEQTKNIAQFVLEKTEGKPYNFALIAYHNSDHAYRYFLEIWGRPPVVILNPTIDPERKTVTEQLLVVCEEKVCQPLGHSLWEIAGFGRAEIENEWQVSSVHIFKLKHYTP